MNTDIVVKKSKKRQHFLDVSIRNNILLEMISTQVYDQYKTLNLTIDMLPTLVMDVFERIHSKPNLTNDERNMITKNIILKLYPLLKSGNKLSIENLKLADIEVMEDSSIDEDTISLINNLVDCFSTLKKKPLIPSRGCLKTVLCFLKSMW